MRHCNQLPLFLATLALALGGAAASPLPSGSARQAADGVQGITPLDQLVLDARTRPAGAPALAEQLAARGAVTTPELFELLVRGAVRVRVGERGRRSERLTESERQEVLGALGAFPWSGVQRFLDERREAAPETAERLVALELLAAAGQASDLGALVDWAQLEGLDVRVPGPVRGAFGLHLGEFLDRRPDEVRSVVGLFGRLNRSLLPAVLTAVTATPGPGRLEALGELLGQVPAFDAHVLAELSAIARRARFAPDERTLASARRYLSSSERVLRLEAIAAVRYLSDRRAVPGLIELVDRRDPDLRRRALEALTAITGEQIEPSAEVWSEWYELAQTWWEVQASEDLSRARNAPPGIAARALSELATRRLYRHELVAPIADVLRRDNLELVVLATAALGHLGSPAAIPHLVRQLEERDVDRRRAAYQALRRMTGENHGDDPAAWRAAGWGVDG